MVMELKEDCCGIELGNLCLQVIYSIFSKIPVKSLTKLKCVSRTWRDFINEFRRFHRPATASGLVLLSSNHPAVQESIFIKAHEQHCRWLAGFEETEFYRRIKLRLHLIDSRCGLLLYGTSDSQFWTYYVFNPLLDQFLPLPRVHEAKRLACASLVFDESCHKNFKVICAFLEEIDVMKDSMRCKIFCSKKREWREMEARLFNLHLAKGFFNKQLIGPSAFSRGRLYWIWSLCMLVFDSEEEFFKLIPLPSKAAHQSERNSRNSLSQFLWESEDQIYFCFQLKELLCIFKFTGADHLLFKDDDYNSMDSGLWGFHRSVNLQEITVREVGLLGDGKLFRARHTLIRPCGFNQDLQLLFLYVPPERIVSYSLETEEFEPVWCCRELETCNSSNIVQVLPFLFKSVHLFT
ncbi:OLC1v1017995C1 [Oldenlandia corymbosa var. corymbosa]|uniref:OLC1v1017995C1 n=1 Tax=Oldenlandia corymbosa var. corymbosa TaxID=529605 RepID=A0AAV1EAP9_OLDCO|nr:OLC1v1017995C1 [Oldenlandia corymbosa var. corymbosa]